MDGFITVRTKKGILFQGNIWEIIYLLIFQTSYVLIEEVQQLSIDGQPIPMPDSMIDRT